MNCSIPNASLEISSEDNIHQLLIFSLAGGQGTEPVTTSSCGVYLTSQAGKIISVVLLEHSPCASGVFVHLWDNAMRKRWDVCPTWHVPGPAFMTSSTALEIVVELNGVSDPCDFNISAMAVLKPPRGELELRNLSATEGKVLIGVID